MGQEDVTAEGSPDSHDLSLGPSTPPHQDRHTVYGYSPGDPVDGRRRRPGKRVVRSPRPCGRYFIQPYYSYLCLTSFKTLWIFTALMISFTLCLLVTPDCSPSRRYLRTTSVPVSGSSDAIFAVWGRTHSHSPRREDFGPRDLVFRGYCHSSPLVPVSSCCSNTHFSGSICRFETFIGNTCRGR